MVIRYEKNDGRIRHIIALLTDMVYSEPFVIVDHEASGYGKRSGNLRVSGTFVNGTGAPGTPFKVEFPMCFIKNNATDDEIIAWRDNKELA